MRGKVRKRRKCFCEDLEPAGLGWGPELHLNSRTRPSQATQSHTSAPLIPINQWKGPTVLMEHLHKAEDNTTGVHEERCWERLVSSCFSLTVVQWVQGEQTSTHSPCLDRRWSPQQQAWTWSHTGVLFCGTTMIYRCPGGHEHTESTVKNGPTSAGNPSTSLACTLPRRPLVSTASANQLSQQIKKPVKINHCHCPKETCYYRCILFLPTIRR